MAKVNDKVYGSGDEAKAAARRFAARGNELGWKVVAGKLHDRDGTYTWRVAFMADPDTAGIAHFEPVSVYASKALGKLYAPNPAPSKGEGPDAVATYDALLAFDAFAGGDGKTPDLAVLLAFLRALAHLEQALHWQTRGEAYYADHLLYQRLYEETAQDIDALAERVVGMGHFSLVDPAVQLDLMQQALAAISWTSTSSLTASDLAHRAANAEYDFMDVLRHAMDSLKRRKRNTYGLENLLAGIADKHESHLYLLQQRTEQEE